MHHVWQLGRLTPFTIFFMPRHASIHTNAINVQHTDQTPPRIRNGAPHIHCYLSIQSSRNLENIVLFLIVWHIYKVT